MSTTRSTITPEQRRDRRARADQITAILKQIEKLNYDLGHAQFYHGAISKSLRWEAETALRELDKKLRDERLALR